MINSFSDLHLFFNFDVCVKSSDSSKLSLTGHLCVFSQRPQEDECPPEDVDRDTSLLYISPVPFWVLNVLLRTW